MSQSGSWKQTTLTRTEILRAVVADAESMGLRDKDKIEQLTSMVIERLERQQRPPTLPGMEDMVSKTSLKQRPAPTRAEIQAIVHEIMAAEEPIKMDEIKARLETTESFPQGKTVSKKKETKAMPEQTARTKHASNAMAPAMILTDNARQVLEKRYLKKD